MTNTRASEYIRQLTVLAQAAWQYVVAHAYLRLLSAFGLYSLVSFLYFGPSALSQLASHIFSDGQDTQQFVWMYNWWPFALTHHLNPFVSQYNWWPLHYSITWATSIAGLALLMTPVTLLGNALLAYNLMALLSPALAATASFALVYYLSQKYLAALFAGYIYGFSSFELSQMLGHAQMYAIFVPPLLILLFLLLANGRLARGHYALLSTVLLALQFTISEEIFATFIGFAIVALVLFYVVMPELRPRLAKAAQPAGLALLLSFVLVAPFLYYMYIGRHDVPKIIHPLSPFSINVANYIVPTELTLVGGRQLQILSRHFTANLSENGAYIGLPLALLLAYVAVKHWRDKIIRTLTILLASVMVAALGPRLHLIGQVGAALPMPWQLVSWLPLVKSAQPDRFTLFIFLIITVIIGYWATLPGSPKLSRSKLVAICIGLVFLVPNARLYTWSDIPVPSFFRPTVISKQLPANSHVIILPFERQGSSAYYQYFSGMYFKQTGAYTGFVPNSYAADPTITALSQGTAGPTFAVDLGRFCRQHNITQIIYTSDTPTSLRESLSTLGWPIRQTHGVRIVTVPRNHSK